MAKKDSDKLQRQYLGSPESFTSQFFSNLLLEQSLHEYFHKCVAEGYLVMYKAASINVGLDGGRGYVLVMYTEFGAYVQGGANVGGAEAYLDLGKWFSRENAFPINIVGGLAGENLSNVKYDVVYLADADMASVTAFIQYIRSGLPSVVRDGQMSRGSGAIWVVPTIMFYLGNIQNENELFERSRHYVLEGFAKSSFKNSASEYEKSAIARSQQMWPEVQGLWTRFVDNVGVFLPNYLDVDLNLTADLGSRFVGCRYVRAGNSDAENLSYNTSFTFRLFGALGLGTGSGANEPSKGANVPVNYDYGLGNTGTYYIGERAGGGGGASYGAGMIMRAVLGSLNLAGQYGEESTRIVFPRIRAFGRQYSPDITGRIYSIPTQQDAVYALNSVVGPQQTTDVKVGGAVGTIRLNYWKYGYKVIFVPTAEQWKLFVDKLQAYISSAAMGSGGAMTGFPY